MKNQMPNPNIAMPMTAFSRCWPANVTGALLMRPDNLPKAITDPENVIAPMKVPMKSSSLLPVGMGLARPMAVGS